MFGVVLGVELVSIISASGEHKELDVETRQTTVESPDTIAKTPDTITELPSKSPILYFRPYFPKSQDFHSQIEYGLINTSTQHLVMKRVTGTISMV